MIRIREGGPAAERERPARTRGRLGVAAILVIGLITLPWAVHPWYDPTPDGSLYLITAQSLLDVQGYTIFGEPFHLRPPGFTLFLVPVLAAGGGFAAIHVLVSVLGILGLAALYSLQRTRIGGPLALAAAVILAVTPGFRILCNQVMSDVPGFALLMGCLLLERRVSRGSSVAGEILLGLCIGTAATVRTVVVLLLPAVLVSRVADRWLGGERGTSEAAFVWRRLGVVTAAVIAAQLPWSLADRPGADDPPADQTARFSYSTGMWHEDEGDPTSRRLTLGEILRERVPERLTDIAGSFGSGLRADDFTPARGAAAAVFGLSLLWVLLKRRSPSDVFALGALTLLSVYFGYKPRLLLPVYALAVPAVLETARDLAGGLLRARAAGVVTGALALVWAAAVFTPRPGWVRVREAHEREAALAAEISARLQPDDRVGASVGWDWSVYLDRPVWT
ncbi:MAG TPA: glycosyltransferase family 39 protein, partial [bacterium]|nr:glycosyltransferase family 39 protein [bacterium]